MKFSIWRNHERKSALIIGNTEYTDLGLAWLTAPADADDFARVLKDKEFAHSMKSVFY
ncbi:MAG: hypothetical protein U0X87_11410 [Anaerolineales bacterium]